MWRGMDLIPCDQNNKFSLHTFLLNELAFKRADGILLPGKLFRFSTFIFLTVRSLQPPYINKVSCKLQFPAKFFQGLQKYHYYILILKSLKSRCPSYAHVQVFPWDFSETVRLTASFNCLILSPSSISPTNQSALVPHFQSAFKTLSPDHFYLQVEPQNMLSRYITYYRIMKCVFTNLTIATCMLAVESRPRVRHLPGPRFNALNLAQLAKLDLYTRH